ncbi:MAG: hypothetical protein MUP70_09070 [Candidatus Aminicenantes bacterium]|nr:hypothetical protein [Candidatus Aminicenantes bacterium]
MKDGVRGTLIFFNSEGDYVNEIKRQELLMSGFCVIDSFGVIYFEKPGMFDPSFLIKTCPPYAQFEQIASLERPSDRVVFPSLLRFALLPNDHLVWGISTRYELNIVNPDGRLIKKIFKEDVPTPVSEDYKDKYYGVLPPGISKESQNFRKYFPAFDFIFCDYEGRLFVITFNKWEGSESYVIDVFDEEGKFIAQTALEIADEISLFQDKCIIRNGKFYTKSYTQNDFPVIKRFNIKWNVPETN